MCLPDFHYFWVSRFSDPYTIPIYVLSGLYWAGSLAFQGYRGYGGGVNVVPVNKEIGGLHGEGDIRISVKMTVI